MTQRAILAGTNPTVVIKAGANVTVKAVEAETVTAITESRWGLKVEKRPAAEFARARAAVGEKVLFDWSFNKPGAPATDENVIQVQLGGSGEVLVPIRANVKVFAGASVDVKDVRGQVDAVAGAKVNLKNVYSIGNASAGANMELDCDTIPTDKVEFKAGGNIRCHIHDLTSAHIRVKDLGGFWEAKIGAGEKSISFKCGGDLTLVTDQKVEPLPPDYVLGNIEKPTPSN